MKTRISFLIALFAFVAVFGQTTRHNKVRIGVAPLAAETDEIIAIKPNGLIVNSGIRVEDIIGGVGTPSSSNYTLTEDEASNTITLNREGLPLNTINLENYLDDTNLARIVSATFNGSTLTLTRDDNSTINVPISTSSTPFEIVNIFVAPQGPESQSLQQRMTNGLNAKDPDIFIGANQLGLVDAYYNKNGKTYKNTWFIKKSGRNYGVNSAQVNELIYEPVIVNQVLRNNADNRIELGNIGISEIQDAVNSQDPPIVIDRTAIIVATQNLQQREWYFNGESDTYGVGASQSVSQDFILLNDETGNDTGQPFIPTLQEVTDEGSFTNNRITVNGINSEADLIVEALTRLDDDLIFTGEAFNQTISANALAPSANNFTLPRTGTRLLSENDLPSGTISFVGAEGYAETGTIDGGDLFVRLGDSDEQDARITIDSQRDEIRITADSTLIENIKTNEIRLTSFVAQGLSSIKLFPNIKFLDTTYSQILQAKSGTIALKSDIPTGGGGSSQNLQQVTDIGSTTTNSITANSFITNNGTNQQVVAGDGTLLNVSDLGGGSSSNATGLERISQLPDDSYRIIGKSPTDLNNLGVGAISIIPNISSGLGVNGGVNGDYSVAIGYSSENAGQSSVSLGRGARTRGSGSIAIGDGAFSDNGSIHITNGTLGSYTDNSAINIGAKNNANRGVTFGRSLQTDNYWTTVFGHRNELVTTQNNTQNSFSLDNPALIVGIGNNNVGSEDNGLEVYYSGTTRLVPHPLANVANPQAGMLIIDSADANKLKFYDGTAWRTVSFQ